MGVYIKAFNYERKINERSNPSEREPFDSQNEESQRGDLHDQFSDSSQDNPEMNKERQNTMNSSDNKELNPLSGKSLIEGHKEQENKFGLVYNNTCQNILYDFNDEIKKYNERKNYLNMILNKSTIFLIINNNNATFEKVSYNDGKSEKTYEQFTTPSKLEREKKYISCEDSIFFEIYYSNLIKFLDEIKEFAKTSFCTIKSQNKLLIKIDLTEVNENTDNPKIIINSKYIIENLFSGKKREYQDKDILNHCNYENFKSFLEEIKKMLDQPSNNINDSINFGSNYPKLISKFDLKGKVKEFAENIRELNDGSFKSDGKKVKFNIKELNSNKKIEDYFKNKSKFLFPTGKKIVYITLKKNAHFIESNTSNSNIETRYSCNNLFKLKNNDYIICDKDGLYYGPKINDPEVTDKIDTILVCELSKEDFIGGIKINDDFAAFMSNGKNKLIFYNTNSKQILMENENENEIKNYSFNSSGNFCSIMKVPKSEDNKLLLAACKKYIQGDKNGILLIKLQYNKDKNEIKTSKKFYDTENFEVYSFCPIFKIDNKEILNAQKIESEYFLVGGFDITKGEGLIKLYKVIYSDEIKNTEIELIQENIIEKMEGQNNSELFKRKKPITCIEQTSEGEILVVYDENVYLFSAPKI